MCEFLMCYYQPSEYLVMANAGFGMAKYIVTLTWCVSLTLMSLGPPRVISHRRAICLSMCYNCIGLDRKRWENIILLITK